MPENLLKLLADRNRLFILASCSQDDCFATDIAACLGLKQATVSCHLALMKKESLLCVHPQKNWHGYYLNPDLLPDSMSIIRPVLTLMYQDQDWQLFHEKMMRMKELRRLKENYNPSF